MTNISRYYYIFFFCPILFSFLFCFLNHNFNFTKCNIDFQLMKPFEQRKTNIKM